MSSPDPRWSILWRGPLASCNYACPYCPFAKTRDDRAALADDARRLGRFVDWVAGRAERIGVLFTPWGEALGHRAYQEAMIRLSHLPNVWKVAAQTNLSASLPWLARANPATTALWATYHPGETTLARFLRQCATAQAAGVPFSVGIVGRREVFDDIERLRDALDPAIYVWINAWKREADYYTADEVARLERIDPHFRLNLHPQPTRGGLCLGGHTTFTVDGAGDVRRCHFLGGVLGNIYEAGFEAALRPRACPAATCGCHIGYVHYEPLRLHEVFGDGVLERIPAAWPASALPAREGALSSVA